MTLLNKVGFGATLCSMGLGVLIGREVTIGLGAGLGVENKTGLGVLTGLLCNTGLGAGVLIGLGAGLDARLGAKELIAFDTLDTADLRG